MQADQTVLSLRPGGGGKRSSMLLAPRLDLPAFLSAGSVTALSSASDASVFRTHGVPSKVVDVPEDILKIKKVIEAELHGEDQSSGGSDSNLSCKINFKLSIMSLRIEIGASVLDKCPQAEGTSHGILSASIKSHLHLIQGN